MQIHISAADGVPIYLQIVNQVKYLVASGRLEAGEELPPIRTLAERLTINCSASTRMAGSSTPEASRPAATRYFTWLTIWR